MSQLVADATFSPTPRQPGMDPTLPIKKLHTAAAPHPPKSRVVTVVVSPELRQKLESRVEQLRELLPTAGRAGPVLQAELDRLLPYYNRVHGQLADSPVMEVPEGMSAAAVIAPPPQLAKDLAAARDAQLEDVRRALANRDNWSGGSMPPVIAEALENLKPGRVALEALLNRSDVRNAINTKLVDFAYDRVERWDNLRQTLSDANHIFGLSL